MAQGTYGQDASALKVWILEAQSFRHPKRPMRTKRLLDVRQVPRAPRVDSCQTAGFLVCGLLTRAWLRARTDEPTSAEGPFRRIE